MNYVLKEESSRISQTKVLKDGSLPVTSVNYVSGFSNYWERNALSKAKVMIQLLILSEFT